MMGGAIGKRQQGSGSVPVPGPVPVPVTVSVTGPVTGPPGPLPSCATPFGSLPIGLGIPGTTIPTATVPRNRRGLPLKNGTSMSEFNLMDMATNLTHRFSVLSGLSFISFVSVPPPEGNRRPRSKISRKRWQPSTLQNEYAQCKTVWPVAQTEALFLPEFPVGIEEKLKLIFMGEISRGAFGQVFHVKCASTNKEFAMKVLSKSQVCSLDAVRQVKQEVMIQHMCSHHTFITPLTRFWQTRKLLIVMTEYVGYGELQQLWRSLGRFPENLLTLYVAEMALALDFLHNAGIIFRDLKMENVLLDVNGHIKIIDFGLARWLSYGGRTRTICGTLQFMAPEVLKGEDYGHSADWWSLGIIAYCLLAGHYPVSGHDDHVTMSSAVDKFSYLPPANASRAMKSLLTGLLDRSTTTRLHTLNQLRKEAAFMRMDFDVIRDKKISPRRVLEEYIEGKSRPYFDDFAGLTSTPKKTYSGGEIHRLATTTSLLQPSCNYLHKGLLGGIGDKAKRSASSPLLSSPLMHPGRLGHHDALLKSATAPDHNGAAVPILQSPLLRLARGQSGPPRNRRSQRAVSASALPTAVSPLLVNVRGNRRSRWALRTREGDRGGGRRSKATVAIKENNDGHSSSSEGIANTDILCGMNGVYGKSGDGAAVGECVVRPDAKRNRSNDENKYKIDTTLPWPLRNLEDRVPRGVVTTTAQEEDPLDYSKEFFNNLITSTPKKESLQKLRSSSQPLNASVQGSKCRLLNGTLGRNNNNCNPLDEKDFDDSFDNFPWISDSMNS